MRITVRRIESPCEIAILNGYTNCDPLRAVNPRLAGKARLDVDEAVEVPPRRERLEHGITDTLHSFIRDLGRLPDIQFIHEHGHGYGINNAPMDPVKQTELGGNFRPEADPVIGVLNITNYVSDRGGNGTLVNSFPLDTFYGHDTRGTDDPDHFKVQIHAPTLPVTVPEVKVTLYAMEPHYSKSAVAGRNVVHHVANRYTRPKHVLSGARTLTVVCKRIGKTLFLRSPYLRLVTSSASQAKRPKQCLLVTDYWDETAAPKYLRHYAEILHQQVEAEIILAGPPFNTCKRAGPEQCGVYKMIPIDRGRTVHMAIHILDGTTASEEDLRKTVYHWTRRVLASANARPVIELVHKVKEPKNMLIVAGGGSGATAGTTALRGLHASGRDSAGNPSQMSFTVDGTVLTYRPSRTDSPETTANGIKAVIENNATLKAAGYTAKVFKSSFRNLAAVAVHVSSPFDVIVLKGNGDPAVVTNVTFNEVRVLAQGPQTLDRVRSFALNNFPCQSVVFGGASDEQRVLRWNYSVDNCINFYVVGDPITLHRNNAPLQLALDGFSPYGTLLGWIADVGPSVYITTSGAKTRLFVFAHEMFHPLMHNVHCQAPRNDANAAGATRDVTVECMNAGLTEADTHDTTKHVADAPIAASYELLESAAPPVLVDGGVGPPPRTTPVQRLILAAGTFGILRNGAVTPLDPVVTDLPARIADA